ncbi:ComEC/Rec2 family competence protein [Paenibacillus favisporus]|uniref:ComEC/Rec2 family competence protein n=1 Tax=Paenibacillus favisporus TaxID=221028 RepID=UPI002DBD83BC|nr:ComEC/Rec2 family competence protein [Paenibacillus favisporus]MEC0176401.1 ComEC/Rec2 family competence protein [Paenibacillus favisporus]
MKTSKITTLLLTGVITALLILSGCSLEINPAAPENNSTPASTGRGNLRVVFLDVGQGASQLIISPSGKTMLIDAGNNDKEELMLQYMEQYGITKLDTVIGTHPDADHIGGLDAVINHIPVGRIYMPKAQANTKTFESVLRAVKNARLKVQTAKAGISWDMDDEVHVDMLAPRKSYDDSNNMSAVVKITYGRTSFLLTGDAEADSERDMLDAGTDLQADVMLVGHHGSKSSTTLAFLKGVHPKYAVIQVGADNTYGHPKSVILNRLKQQSVKVYRNDLQGTIEAESNGQKVTFRTER